MTQRIDITGQRFGRLTAIQHVRGHRWLCACDCGNTTETISYDIRHGRIMSCGCLRSELSAERGTTHGMTKTPTYRSWLSMRRRCSEPEHPQYKYYGGKGIKVCKRWQNSFRPF